MKVNNNFFEFQWCCSPCRMFGNPQDVIRNSRINLWLTPKVLLFLLSFDEVLRNEHYFTISIKKKPSTIVIDQFQSNEF